MDDHRVGMVWLGMALSTLPCARCVGIADVASGGGLGIVCVDVVEER